MPKPTKLEERLQLLDAERLVLTVELRCELMRQAKKLLPAAIAQARAKKGSPALLRIITRLAMRPANIERRH
jgi:hypothetical protein